MLSRTLVLLATTLLGSFADEIQDDDFFNDRRSSINSNANINEILGGFERGRNLGLENSRVRGGSRDDKKKIGLILRPVIGREKNRGVLYGPMKHGRVVIGAGHDSDDIDLDDYLRGDTVPDFCDDHLHNRFYHDEDDNELTTSDKSTDEDGNSERLVDKNSNYNVVFKESRRSRGSKRRGQSRGGNNVNSNANNNFLGPRYRRTSSSIPNRPVYGVRSKYDKGYVGTNTNMNSNTNVFTGRRSNVNSNINSNVNTIDRHYGGHGRPQARRGQKDRYDQQYGWDDSPSYTQKVPAPASYTTPSYWIGYRDKDDLADMEDVQSPSESNNNINMNSNTNIISRRNSVNANSNSNSNRFSRIRRSVKNLNELNRDEKIDDETSTMADNESSTALNGVAEKWESPRGAIY